METADALGANLLFLVSQPRAGSTLLQKILGGHSAIHTQSEPWIALHPLFALRQQGHDSVYSSALYRQAAIHFLEQLPNGEQAWWEANRRMLGYLYGCALERSGKRLFLDKTPRYYLILPELRKVFPRARFILLFRHPLAVLVSMLETFPAGTEQEYLRDLRSDLVDAPRLLLNGGTALGHSATCIRYEALVAHPEAVIGRLLDWLNLPREPSIIHYGDGETSSQWMFGDQGLVYSEPSPVASRAERWREVLARSPEWRNHGEVCLRALGQDLMEQLGYDVPDWFDGNRKC